MWSTLRAGARSVVLQARSRAAGLGFDAQPGALLLVTGGGDWAVREIAHGLQPHFAAHFRDVMILDQLAQRPYVSRANVHCLCRPAYFKGAGVPPLHPSNRLVVSWLHGGRMSNSPEMVAACRQLERHWRRVRRFVVPNTRTLHDVLECGVDAARVSVIPNGVNTRLFQPCPDAAHRAEVRQRLGLPPDAFVVGSFQRDEDDEGQPKWVKGPDVLVEALSRAHQQSPLHALLTGPTRHYVRKGLQSRGVPFTHVKQSAVADMGQMYHALDAYCVSSREEGGPAPLRESMASGVPVVSTRVGLAVDLMTSGQNGLVFEVEDAAGLASGLLQLADDPALGIRLAGAALDTVRALDFSVVAQRLRTEVYAEAFE